MKLISWNVNCTGHQVNDLVSKYNPDILVVMETGVNSIRTSKIIEENQFAYYMEFSPRGFFGGFGSLEKTIYNFQLMY